MIGNKLYSFMSSVNVFVGEKKKQLTCTLKILNMKTGTYNCSKMQNINHWKWGTKETTTETCNVTIVIMLLHGNSDLTLRLTKVGYHQIFDRPGTRVPKHGIGCPDCTVFLEVAPIIMAFLFIIWTLT